MEHPIYFQQSLNHKHILVKAALKNPPTSVEQVSDWLARMVDAVGMKILFGPNVVRCDTYGNEGVTGVVVIETSHASIHVWERASVPFAMFDLYSCKDFPSDAVISMFEDFDPYFVTWTVIDRNLDNFSILEQDAKQFTTITSLLSDQDRDNYKKSRGLRSDQMTPEMKSARASYARLKRKFYYTENLHDKQNYEKRKISHKATLTEIKHRATKNGLDFDLTPEWYEGELAKAVAKWNNLKIHSSDRDFWAASVDRVDPSDGYVQRNCRIIPYGLNQAKSDWQPQQLKELKNLLEDELSTNTDEDTVQLKLPI